MVSLRKSLIAGLIGFLSMGVSAQNPMTCPPPATLTTTLIQYTPSVQLQTVTSIQYTPSIVLQTVTTIVVQTTTSVLLQTSTTIQYQTTTAVVTATTTQIVPTTITQTQTATTTATTTKPITLTASEELLLFTSTARVTHITLCPVRNVNPTFSIPKPYPTDWTWGCPPGWLCKPTRNNCNFEPGLPARDFFCAPNECIPAESLPTLQTWDATIYGNSTPATNPNLQVQAIDSYFNMAPADFGFTYEIFVVNEAVTITSTIFHQPTQVVGARQAQTTIPGACYPWCNNCLLEAQSVGKVPALCQPGSPYEVSLGQCQQCIQVHKTDGSAGFVQIAPQFQQYLDYCASLTSTVVVPTSTTTTATNAAQSTFTSVLSSATTVIIATPPVTTSAVASSPSSPASASVSLTTATLISTITGTKTTLSGTALAQVTIILPAGSSQTTLSSSALSGATVILPGAFYAGSSTSTLTALSTSAAGSTNSTSTSRASGSSNSTGSATVASSTGTAAHSVVQYSFMSFLIPGLIMILSIIIEI